MDEVLCDVAPNDVSDVLLGQPYLWKLLGLQILQYWQVQTLQTLHQTALEYEDLAILDLERDLSMYVFKNMIFKASSMIFG